MRPGQRLVRHAWDFDGDGVFDAADGPVVLKTFPMRGANNIGLELTAAGGAQDVTFRIRSGKAPRRRDRCRRPGETKGSACPRE